MKRKPVPGFNVSKSSLFSDDSITFNNPSLATFSFSNTTSLVSNTHINPNNISTINTSSPSSVHNDNMSVHNDNLLIHNPTRNHLNLPSNNTNNIANKTIDAKTLDIKPSIIPDITSSNKGFNINNFFNTISDISFYTGYYLSLLEQINSDLISLPFTSKFINPDLLNVIILNLYHDGFLILKDPSSDKTIIMKNTAFSSNKI